MASLLASHKIGLRMPAGKKAQFAALASAQGLSQSGLLAQLIDHVLDGQAAPVVAPASGEPAALCERLTLRLRPGDRTLVQARAAARGMKPSTYLVALVHAHVRGDSPLPVTELNWFKACVGELSALVRVLVALQAQRGAALEGDPDAHLHDLIQQALARSERLRLALADLVRANLASWEGDHG